MTAFLFVVFLGLTALLLTIRKETFNLEEQAAISLLVEKGCDVEFNGWHIYYSKHSKKYILLRVDRDEEHSFDRIEDAVADYVSRTILK